MDWGLKNRLSRIIKPATGKTVMLAVDHGYFLGPTTGLEEAEKTITPLVPEADAIMLTRGLLRTCVNANWDIPVVLRVSGGTSILTELSNEAITVSVEEALRLNASALTSSIFVGAPHEKESLIGLSHLVNEGSRYGLPVLAVTAVGKDMARDARYLGLACRIAAEMGAHLVKTYHCENFEEVAKSCPVPLIVAGGKKTSELDALDLTYKALQDGAVGVDMGRNIFQSENPVAMIKAVKAIVHEKKSADEAYVLFQTLSKNGQSQRKSYSDKKTAKTPAHSWD